MDGGEFNPDATCFVNEEWIPCAGGRLQSRFSFNLISVTRDIKCSMTWNFHVQICHRGTPGGDI